MYLLQSEPARKQFASTDKLYYDKNSKWEFVDDRQKATKFKSLEEAEKTKKELMKIDRMPIKIIKVKEGK